MQGWIHRNSLAEMFPAIDDVVRMRGVFSERIFVGIDFGTSTTVVAVCAWSEASMRPETVAIEIDRLPSGRATHLVPSVIYLEGGSFLMGQAAKHRGSMGGEKDRNYLSSWKMDLGHEEGARYHQFELAQQPEKRESVASKLADLLGGTQSLIDKQLDIDSPAKATEAFFRVLRKLIEDYRDEHHPMCNLEYCVSIPACFGSSQRAQYRSAMVAAGIPLHDRFLVDEPNAAFLSFLEAGLHEEIGLSASQSGYRNILVFDFGAGTCDLSLIEGGFAGAGESRKLTLKNLALSRFAKLGGDDVDREIAARYLLPFVCERNEIDMGVIQPHIYRRHLEPVLVYIAEKLKILISERQSQENLDPTAIVEYSMDSSIDIALPRSWWDVIKGDSANIVTVPRTFGIQVAEFDRLVAQFVYGETAHQEPGESTISGFLRRISLFTKSVQPRALDLVDNVLNKASVTAADIDAIVFVGGSSNLKAIQDAVSEHFNEEIPIVVPEDMQSHVARGVALHAFLSHGLNANPISEILAEDILLLTKDGEEIVFSAGTEIPATVTLTALKKNRAGQRTFELPFLAGDERRVVARIRNRLPSGVKPNDEIHLEAFVDSHKVIRLDCHYMGGKILAGEEVFPFATESVDKYREKAGALLAELNVAVRKEGFALGVNSLHSEYFEDIQRTYSALLRLYAFHKEYLECLGLIEMYEPDNYTDIAYYAAKAALPEVSRTYKRKAYDENRDGVAAYNLAIEYGTGSREYRELMEEAVSLGDHSAMICVSDLISEEDPDKAEELFSRASKHYLGRFRSEPDMLAEWEYHLVLKVANRLSDSKLTSEVEAAKARNARSAKSDKSEFKDRNLLSKV